MLHLQLFRCDPFYPAVIAERVFFKDQVAPFDIQRIAFQHQLLALRGQQASVVRGGDHENRSHDNGNKQKERQFPVAQKIAADHGRQRMTFRAAKRSGYFA